MRPSTASADDLKAAVRAKYAAIAQGDDECCADPASEVDVSDDYELATDPATDADLNLGCGLPTEATELQPGERVVDLGSGAGMDAFVARRDVGAAGHVHGVDMVEEMVEKARANAKALGYQNVTFEVGDIEALPLADEAFDVALSNCVLNLVPDKKLAFSEIHRVLRSGGRFSISDVVHTGILPDALREPAALYVGCIGGAMERDEYLALIREAGFVDVQIVTEKRIDLPDELLRTHLDADARARFRESGAGLRSITVCGMKSP